jgi:hypothetical protein
MNDNPRKASILRDLAEAYDYCPAIRAELEKLAEEWAELEVQIYETRTFTGE